MFSDDQIRVECFWYAGIILFHDIPTSSRSDQCRERQQFSEAEDVQQSQRERKGMTDFHMNPNKAPIVPPAL